MTSEEKTTWVQGILSALTYTAYVSVILALASGRPITDVPYISPMLWAIGVSIVAAIVITILIGILSPRSAGRKDQRDREIYRFGEYTGHGWLVVGALGSIIMAMFKVDHFWIANALYLAFTLSAITSCIARIVAYRGGFQQW